MQTELRDAFNASFGEDLYREFLQELGARLGCGFGFRVAETPVFLPAAFRTRLEEAARGILAQISDPARIETMVREVPERYAMAGRGDLPGIAILDFAVVRDANGDLAPKLVELQGFPSLLSLTILQAELWGEICGRMPGMPKRWTGLFSGLDREGFLALMRACIVGKHPPEEVALVDLEPEKQKTSPDFFATRKLFGVDMICPTTIVREGKRLFRRREGKLVPLRRIYQRVVFDELEKSGKVLPFGFREELDVEWFPHPAWYFIWSKSSLPHLDHPAVPRTLRLSGLERVPSAEELRRYVLKPFYSFAGGGVNVDPTEADVRAIPEGDRAGWCLQEKVEYTPALRAVDGGGVKVEVRTMFLRPDGAKEFTFATNLCRLSRGKMLGVDFNKDFTWVGGSVGIWPAGGGG